MEKRLLARLALSEVDSLARAVLELHGFSREQALAVARTMVCGQRDECASHGVYRLLVCIATLKAGKVDPRAEPQVHDHAPGSVRVDAAGGFSQLAFDRGVPLLRRKAVDNGVAALVINRCVHFSALWVEIETLTDLGLVTLACNPSHAWVAPAGGRGPVFGTNPIAFGWPRPGKDPFVFDMATSAIARGDIELHRRAGKPVPLGWGVSADGEPTTSAEAVLQGAMLTFGGHKGSALAAMIELLAGPLIGDLTSAQSLAHDAGAGASPFHGELILAFDPRRFLGERYEHYLHSAETLFDSIEQQGARLPSARRYEARRRSLAQGVEINDELLDELNALLHR
ncbi:MULTISPECIES: Ldh family oxidoreductase [Pseudomonas]|jgi:delta1-piperideine-2-carboxylate reductase|uniref:Ldh family oxidoreductase n=2 Tax=Pseudomonas TaxID=286 RepID=UPI000A6C8DEE|nr:MULTISPECIES: Ldh family oxidoreductase [Pseudomonas]NPA19906.1 Ldh family oxidoreductase [Gammaproteobacteria bacterium]QPN48233.1 Ldh family oxidoreductase [Priestia aryabhattai]WPE29855.1 Delta(1)-pyrroline-2-carboxylate/Delta(1)-piperideine-2-carboxylate reductase [Pseudomonas hunanensis]MBP2086287.1 LDH2 family malate/lactate/ureidoglycolate dehydrogenase [Pseudomonas sp. PvP089]MBP2092725.1 LDH2 family malate/lactate/ureidoglycolate dehydrogenase [Pseudomonas sp. PvP088]|eukprot:gene11393-13279_t